MDLAIPQAAGETATSSLSGLRIVSKVRHSPGFSGSLLVLTNSRMLEDGERALQAGCDGYLCKHAPLSEIQSMVEELKIAMQGQVVLVPRTMRHVFLREELSTKEARLMELLNEGASWAEIARELGYKSAGAASTIGYRVFDKILQDLEPDSEEGKKQRALSKWRARTRVSEELR